MARTKDPARREALVQVATRLFAERGYAGVTVPELAKAAGAGTATLYRHFADKEALANAAYRMHKTALLACVPPLPSKPSRAAFTELFTEVSAWAKADPHAARFLATADHAAYVDEESRALSGRVEAAVVAFVRAACPRGGDPKARVVLVGAVLTAILQQFAEGTKAGRGVKAEALAGACWSGVGGPG